MLFIYSICLVFRLIFWIIYAHQLYIRSRLNLYLFDYLILVVVVICSVFLVEFMMSNFACQSRKFIVSAWIVVNLAIQLTYLNQKEIKGIRGCTFELSAQCEQQLFVENKDLLQMLGYDYDSSNFLCLLCRINAIVNTSYA